MQLSSFDYHCLNCKKLMETSDAAVVAGPFICGFCGATMALDAAKGLGLTQQPCLARNTGLPSRTPLSDKLAGIASDRTQLPHSGARRT